MNELSSLLKRSFEGLGLCQGDYEEAAAVIVWLEARGMKGLDALKLAWPRLAGNGRIGVELAASDADTQTIDAKGNTALICARSAVELAMARASTGDVGRVELQRCHECQAVLPSLCLCPNRGFAAIAYWRDEHALHVAKISGDQRAPDYYWIDAGTPNELAEDSLTIACSQHDERIEKLASSLANGGISRRAEKRIPATELEARFERTVEHGIAIDAELAEKLNEAASAVLVEATEQSRLGAGESAQ